jgi:predicted nucleic acid-binding protein
LSFDLSAALRRLRPQRSGARLTRRDVADLPMLDSAAGPALLLDTCVYIDVLQGRAGAEVTSALSARLINHSGVSLCELTHAFGRLDPADPRTSGALRRVGAMIDAIPSHRLTTPTEAAFGQSGMLAGLVMRLAGEGEARTLQNDALLYLHAVERGLTVLTRNQRDFDFFDQLVPSGRVLFYQGRT